MRTRAAAHPPPSPAPSATGEPRRRATVIGLSLALLIVTTAVYLPVRHYDFVNYDDPQFVRDNPHLRSGSTLEKLRWACTAFQVGNWHPLTTFSLVLDYQLFGLNPGPYHLVNLGFHVLNTLLLFGLLTRLTGQPWPSACAAALFALHPLHVESVAWIAERKDVLSTCFWLLTVWAYHAYVRQPGGRRYTLLLALYIAALLSKPMVITLPFVLLLLDFWPLRRVQLGRVQGSEGSKGRGFKGSRVQGFKEEKASPPMNPPTLEPSNPRTLEPFPVEPLTPRTLLLLEKLPLFLLAGSMIAVTFVSERQAGAIGAGLPLSARLANATLSYALYLGKTLWPTKLAVFYPFELVPTWQALGAALILVVISAGVLWGARRYPYLLTGWLWYLGMLVPVIGILEQGALARADRFTYLPLVGVFIIIAWGVPDLLQRWQHRREACAVAAAAALAACTVLTTRQLAFWHDSTSLFEHALAVTHDNLLAHSLIGTLQMDGGQRDAALRNLVAAARICDTSHGEQKICTLAHYNTGLLLAQRGDRDAALQHYRAALRFDASYAKAHVGIGLSLASRGDLAAAAAAYREALRLDPTLASAHNNLAIVLENMGQTDEAIAHYAEGVRLAPQDAGSRSNLAAVLASAGRLPEAIEQFRTAVQLKPDLVEAYVGLAAAYAEVGQFNEAVQTAEVALNLARATNQTPLADAITARLALYRAGQPVKETGRGPQ